MGLTLLENFSRDQQLQIVATHKTSTQSRKSAWHQRTHRLIHPLDKNDKDEPRPLATYIERVISTLKVEIQSMYDIRPLGYEVSIKDFSRPDVPNDLGTNAKGSGKRKREIRDTTNPKTTSSKLVDHTPSAWCVFCGNDPKAQLRLKLPHCDLLKRTCANYDHPDCNKSGASSFEDSGIGKKYTA